MPLPSASTRKMPVSRAVKRPSDEFNSNSRTVSGEGSLTMLPPLRRKTLTRSSSMRVSSSAVSESRRSVIEPIWISARALRSVRTTSPLVKGWLSGARKVSPLLRRSSVRLPGSDSQATRPMRPGGSAKAGVESTSEISSANRESSVKGSRSSRRQRRKYLELFMEGHPVRYGHDPAGCFHQRLKRSCAIRQTHFVAHSVRQQREGQGFFWLKVASLTIRS